MIERRYQTIRYTMKKISNCKADQIVVHGPCRDILVMTRMFALARFLFVSDLDGTLDDWKLDLKDNVRLTNEDGFFVGRSLRLNEMACLNFEFNVWGESLVTEVIVII